MPKRPRTPKREDFNEAAFRVVREATGEGSPEQLQKGPKGHHKTPNTIPPEQSRDNAHPETAD